MESNAKRTLVKSAPELWELADDMTRMQSWMGVLVGADGPIEVEVLSREPGRTLAWRAAQPGPDVRLALELAESGFGTTVRITARHDRPSPDQASTALDALLDELGSPERRPFAAP